MSEREPIERPKINQAIINRMRETALFDIDHIDCPIQHEDAVALLAMLDWYEAGK